MTDRANLRPISYTDDIECLQDALWLSRCRSRIEDYVGKEQHGGRVDAVLVAMAIMVALQLRSAAGGQFFLGASGTGYEWKAHLVQV